MGVSGFDTPYVVTACYSLLAVVDYLVERWI
jgi:hypothetical protein